MVGVPPFAVEVCDDLEGEFAERVVEAFHYRSDDLFSLVLSGGDTARRCYERLAEYASDQIDWWKVDVLWGDERMVGPDDDASNFRLAREALLERVGAANRVEPMRADGDAADYARLVAGLGRLDVVHLGLGGDGHTASLFPDAEALDESERLVVRTTDPRGNNPLERMTLTYPGIARARLVLMTVSGEAKAEPLARLVAGEDIPAARVRADRVVVLADRDAAAGLDRG